MENKFKIGERIKELRNSKGVKQEDLAKFIGVSRTTLSKYEQGVSSLDHETFNKILEFFDISYDEFYFTEKTVNNKISENKKIKNAKDIFKSSIFWLCVSIFFSMLMLIFLYLFAYYHPIYIEEEQSLSYLWWFILWNKPEYIFFKIAFIFFSIFLAVSIFIILGRLIYEKVKNKH